MQQTKGTKTSDHGGLLQLETEIGGYITELRKQHAGITVRIRYDPLADPGTGTPKESSTESKLFLHLFI